MISLVLYGRNDSYGYNLHKRVALSLNCMAEVLTDPEDEILFVDYNTPDDYPTFPEAIEDTLTKKAKMMLRIFRVRPSLHARFVHKTHLKALEPISRNIAIRRSNPANRWILSTNTDMIFVPRDGCSLSDIVRPLESGYWAVPRFEVPESLWESFDRKDPVSVIKAIDHWGRAAHLNEIVRGMDENLFDAPGDFQLVERDVLFRINGFDERMLLGWHVDSNLTKRLWLINRKTCDLSLKLYGYHCDHTRQVTPAHRHNSVENDFSLFFDQITNPVADQEDWGCVHDSIEEIRFGKNNTSLQYLNALHQSIKEELKFPTISLYRPESQDKIDYDPEHVVAFLADLFVNAPRSIHLGWFGFRKRTLDLFVDVWTSLGFTGKILVGPPFDQNLSDNFNKKSCAVLFGESDIFEKADAFVVDFGIFHEGENSEVSLREKSRRLIMSFLEMAETESNRLRLKQGTPRRIVTLNAFHNRFEWMVREVVGTARTPFSTRILQGFLLPSEEVIDLLPKMHLSPTSQRENGKITVGPASGFSIYGPYLILFPGRYRLICQMESGQFSEELVIEKESYFEIVTCYTNVHQERLDLSYFSPPLRSSEFILDFDVSKIVVSDEGFPATYEFRLMWEGKIPIFIREMKLQRLGPPGKEPAFLGVNLILRMTIGPSGKRINAGVLALTRKGYIVFGPYLRLPSGRYRLDLEININRVKVFFLIRTFIEIVISASDGHQIQVAREEISWKEFKGGKVQLMFEVPYEWGSESTMPLPFEFRLWTNGKSSFNLESIMIHRV
ncbi:hypothetical protein [Leptospirillum ferriphilum]|uniref:hypothetical protein n=1 Tax=Leptospirillum ferriphilum TaxID=178606 RepID=UPI00098470FC|nr:hypothetical protein [Leptospirillum ferriphilum]OOH84029.1 hypothetical protein BOX30_01050 [Leptospirillum ferriphilum]